MAYSGHEARRQALKDNDPNVFIRVLDFIAAKMPDHPEFGDKNVLISELAFAQCSPSGCLTDAEFKTFYQEVISKTLNWGAQGLQVWQIYAEEGRNVPNIRDASLNLTQTYEALSRFKGEATPSPKPGDLNNDGKVDIFDLNLLIAGFGTKYTIFDYNTLLQNYGK